MKEETNYIENEKKKRVYKNSLLLFVRIFIITIINLYSVRLVVNGLGVIDYGIFNAVVGVVMTLSCVFPVIAVSVQRFFSSEMGKNNYSMLPIIFSASINIRIQTQHKLLETKAIHRTRNISTFIFK